MKYSTTNETQQIHTGNIVAIVILFNNTNIKLIVKPALINNNRNIMFFFITKILQIHKNQIISTRVIKIKE